jgi:hypothetical protein
VEETPEVRGVIEEGVGHTKEGEKGVKVLVISL